MTRNVLVTGASGFLVGNILKSWITEIPENEFQFYFLTRPTSFDRTRSKFTGYIPDIVKLSTGDVTHPMVLTKPEEYDEIVQRVDTVLHGGGSVSFDNSQSEELEHTNIEGTNNMITLAKHLKKLEKFIFVSTAYVGGIVPEVLEEDNLPERKRENFRNHYEYTKWVAERNVRHSGLPYMVLRPGAMLGSSEPPHKTMGETGTMYGFLTGIGLGFKRQFGRKRFMENIIRGQDPLNVSLRLPGYGRKTTLSFSCIDDVVKSTLSILQSPNAHSGYNLTNSGILYGQDICDAIEKAFNIKGVIPAESDRIEDPNDFERAIMEKSKEFYGYMIGQAPKCSTRNTEETIKGKHNTVQMTSALFTSMMRAYALEEVARVAT